MGMAFPLVYLPRKTMAANERLQVAAIGVGGKGGSDLQHLAKHGEVIALCDVSQRKLDYAAQQYPQAAKFSDYREMISFMGTKIDVLSVSSPDHTHAHAIQLAMAQGMNVFAQSPLAHTVWETQQIAALAVQRNLSTQVGIQGCASDPFRLAVEYLKAGELGNIQEVHTWTNRPVWPQSPIWINRPKEKQSVPANLNWDAFIGPAENRDYHRIYQPYNWRGWRAFGTGALGDAGLHLLNLAVMGCALNELVSVTCLLSGPVNQETFPAWGRVKFEFMNAKGDSPIPLTWYEGRVGNLSAQELGQKNLPPLDLFHGRTPAQNGCLIRGSRGVLYSPSLYGTKWEVYDGKNWMNPDSLSRPSPRFDRNGYGDSGMKEELIHAIRSSNPTFAMANFSYAAKLNEIALLGNAALLAGGGFKWDSSNCISDRTDINSQLTKSYRKGWKVNAA